MNSPGNHIGSLLQLAAKGPQDQHISSNGTTHSFIHNYKTHTQFVIENNVDNLKDISFGKKYVYEIPIKGDLLQNMILEVKLPKLQNEQVYVHNVGTKLIKKVVLRINEELVNEYTGLTMFIFSRLMNNTSKIEAFDRMTSYRSSTSYYSLSNNIDTLYIPLILWESYGIENYIPFCSIFNSKIKLELEFANLDDLYIYPPQTDKFIVQPKLMVKNNKITLNLSVLTLPASTNHIDSFKVDMLSDQIILNKEEQKLLQKQKQEYVFPQLLHQTEKISGNIHKVYLQFNIPIKQIIWVITDYETIDNYEFRDFEQAQFILGDTSHSNNSLYFSADYYKYCQSYYHNEGIPEYNIFSYSFALRPYFGHPSGLVDFSKLKVKILELKGDIKNKYIHIFANGINVLETDNGNSNIKLKLR